MKAKKSLILFTGFCLILMLLVWASKPALTLAKPIRIGCLFPMTASGAMWGKAFKESFELGLKQVDYKVAGSPIEIFIEDDKSDPAVALDKVRKLVEGNKVQIVFGPLLGSSRLSVLPYLRQHKILNVTVAEGALSELEEVGEFASQPGGLWAYVTRPLGAYAYDEMGCRTATTLAADFVAGHEFMQGFTDVFKKKGGVVIQQQWPPFNTFDFSPYLSALKKADCVVTWQAAPPMELAFVKQCYDHGITKEMPMLFLWGEDMEEEMMPELGDYILGMKGAFKYSLRLDTPANKKFIAAFEAQHGHKPTPHSAGAYESLLVVLKALEATGGDTTANKMLQAIAKLKLDTPMGHLIFNSKGMGFRDLYICEIQKVAGKYGWVPIKKYPPSIIE
jgi:branched-chain amino acid transport system substrate-binding protein